MSYFPFKALTFDCFGTLIDWRKGQKLALAQLPSLAEVAIDFEAIDAARLRVEVRMQSSSWRCYADILSESVQEAVQEVHGVFLPRAECKQFAASQASWPAFADSATALSALSAPYRIGLLSNCDSAALETTATEILGLRNPLLVSSEKVQGYKPGRRHWEAAVHAVHCQAEEVLHVSAYKSYDLLPAHELGLKVAWVQRDNEPQPEGIPLAYVATDMIDLAKQLLDLDAR
jgi:2-haloalkanoic acid dehalogenase type II